MYTKQDDQFDDMVANPLRRREGFVNLSSRRGLLCVCAILTTVCALALYFPSHLSRGGTATGFPVATQWMLVFKFESGLTTVGLRVCSPARLCVTVCSCSYSREFVRGPFVQFLAVPAWPFDYGCRHLPRREFSSGWSQHLPGTRAAVCGRR